MIISIWSLENSYTKRKPCDNISQDFVLLSEISDSDINNRRNDLSHFLIKEKSPNLTIRGRKLLFPHVYAHDEPHRHVSWPHLDVRMYAQGRYHRRTVFANVHIGTDHGIYPLRYWKQLCKRYRAIAQLQKQHLSRFRPLWGILLRPSRLK